MTRENKTKKKILRAQLRRSKNKKRNSERLERACNRGNGLDCPFDVDMNGLYGTCHCNHKNYLSCLGDI